MRILLVEDDPMNIEFFRAIAEQDGHDVSVERDGLDGRDRALRECFDLVVVDLQLPRLRGEAVCRAIREAGLIAPIFALTAEAMPDQIAEGLAAGFDRYLTKPVSVQEVREAVRQGARMAEAAAGARWRSPG